MTDARAPRLPQTTLRRLTLGLAVAALTSLADGAWAQSSPVMAPAASAAEHAASASARRAKAEAARSARQQKRIDQGVASGALNEQEAARLARGQDRMAAQQAHAAADGHVSAAEHRRITHAQRHQSHRIHRQKHDAQRAQPAGSAPAQP